MHTAVQSRLSFPEKDVSYTELFGAVSPVYEQECNGEDDIRLIEKEILKGLRSPAQQTSSGEQLKVLDSREFCRDDWEWLQEYGDISAALSEKRKLYECVDINEICGNVGVGVAEVVAEEESDGPTLAELNDGAMSPVVNPDMERLHFVALKTDVDDTAQDEQVLVRPRGYLRSAWLEKPLRASSWLNSSLPMQSADAADIARLQTQQSAACLPTCTKVVKETIDENQNNNTPSQHDNSFTFKRHSDLATIAVNDVISPENKENSSGDPAEKQYQTAASPGKSEESDCASDYDNPTSHQGNSDSDMEEDNFDSDNDEDDDMEANEEEDHRTGRVGRKGRRKEKEDGTPNPRRLLEIGRQLEKLNMTISDLKPVHLLPVQVRNQTRREKNKLASRACRLKKKATHEANKIKIKGLALEKDRLLCSIRDVKRFLLEAASTGKALEYDKYLELENQLTGVQVAGNLHKFVESVLKSATCDGTTFNCATIL